MSNPERQHVVAHLELTESWLADEVSNLSPAQFTYRYAPGKWTILDVVEHLPRQARVLERPPKVHERTVQQAQAAFQRRRHALTASTAPGARRPRPLKSPPASSRTLSKVWQASASCAPQSSTTHARRRGPPRRRFTDWGVGGYLSLLGISTHAKRHILKSARLKAQHGFPMK